MCLYLFVFLCFRIVSHWTILGFPLASAYYSFWYSSTTFLITPTFLALLILLILPSPIIPLPLLALTSLLRLLPATLAPSPRDLLAPFIFILFWSYSSPSFSIAYFLPYFLLLLSPTPTPISPIVFITPILLLLFFLLHSTISAHIHYVAALYQTARSLY